MRLIEKLSNEERLNGQKATDIIKKNPYLQDKDAIKEYEKAKQEFVSSNINKISTNFCCFGQRSDTLTAYSKLLGLVFGKLTPLRLRVDCYLFHGCDPLTTTKSATTSREVYFNSTVTFNQNISFEKLKYCQLPEKSRLSFNIVLIFKE